MSGTGDERGADLDLLIVGDLSKDFTVIDGASETGVGGGVYFAAFAAKPSGIDFLVLTKLAFEDLVLLREFWQEGVPIHALPSPQTTTMYDFFEAATGYRRRSEVSAAASPFTAAEVPPLRARIVCLTAMMHGIVPERLIERFAERGEVALDLQGVLRHRDGRSLEYRRPGRLERLLRRVRYLKVDRREALLAAGTQDAEEAVATILAQGAAELIMTDDRRVIASDGSRRAEATFDAYDIRCRSGRGDTCFAAYLSRRLDHDLEDSLLYAADITNRKLRYPGRYRG